MRNWLGDFLMPEEKRQEESIQTEEALSTGLCMEAGAVEFASDCVLCAVCDIELGYAGKLMSGCF